MAHRGRLNVLSNIMGKSYDAIFREFEGHVDPDSVQGSGDVKYHLGATGKYVSPTRRRHPTRAGRQPQPPRDRRTRSSPGMARAVQDRIEPPGSFPVLPISIHGDAAFAGQGVVAETLAMSDIKGYRVGGTIHLIINNQIGYTTAPEFARSSLYCTDVAKTVQAPIFHVNGDDPEACVRVARLAFEYRQQFHKDVVIDMWCYRRHGHNEGDDPSYTQPLMYQAHRRAPQRAQAVRRVAGEAGRHHRRGGRAARSPTSRTSCRSPSTRRGPRPRRCTRSPGRPSRSACCPTSRPASTGRRSTRSSTPSTAYPEWFTPHPKLAKQFEARAKLFADGEVDWATAEALAIGSLIVEGHSVRLAGEDSRRGTFAHRHAALIDYDNGETWIPLDHLDETRAGHERQFWVYDSLLSEYAALGFEYGYAQSSPETLVMWEAQFGDFINCAQVIVDQYLVAAEDKWGQRNGLVLLLPARLPRPGPRALVGPHRAVPHRRAPRTTSRWATPPRRRSSSTCCAGRCTPSAHTPLVVFTPKEGLRLKQTRSPIDELTRGSFQEVLDDPGVGDPDAVDRVVFCSGKVAWEAMAERDRARGRRRRSSASSSSTRCPTEQMLATLRRYPNAKQLVWLQEEPENMGAWPFVESRTWRVKEQGYDLRHVARVESGSPATGSKAIHDQELADLMDETFS